MTECRTLKNKYRRKHGYTCCPPASPSRGIAPSRITHGIFFISGVPHSLSRQQKPERAVEGCEPRKYVAWVLLKCESPFTVCLMAEDNTSPAPDPQPRQPSAMPAVEHKPEPEPAMKKEPEWLPVVNFILDTLRGLTKSCWNVSRSPVCAGPIYFQVVYLTASSIHSQIIFNSAVSAQPRVWGRVEPRAIVFPLLQVSFIVNGPTQPHTSAAISSSLPSTDLDLYHLLLLHNALRPSLIHHHPIPESPISVDHFWLMCCIKSSFIFTL